MTMRILLAVIAVGIVAIYAIGSGRLVTTAGDWYLALNAPAWQPPNAVFGLAWAYNFIALTAVGIMLALRAAPAVVGWYLIAFAASVVFALAWAYLFYTSHELVAAAIALTLCALTTVAMIVIAFAQTPLLGWLLVPYQLWLVIATSLSWGYWVLNRMV